METDADQQLAAVPLAIEAAADETEAMAQFERSQADTEAAVVDALAAELGAQDEDGAAYRRRRRRHERD